MLLRLSLVGICCWSPATKRSLVSFMPVGHLSLVTAGHMDQWRTLVNTITFQLMCLETPTPHINTFSPSPPLSNSSSPQGESCGLCMPLRLSNHWVDDGTYFAILWHSVRPAETFSSLSYTKKYSRPAPKAFHKCPIALTLGACIQLLFNSQ